MNDDDIIKEYYKRRILLYKSIPELKPKVELALSHAKTKLDSLKREEQMGLFAIYGTKADSIIKRNRDKIMQDLDIALEKIAILTVREEQVIPKPPVYIYEDEVDDVDDELPAGVILVPAPPPPPPPPFIPPGPLPPIIPPI